MAEFYSENIENYMKIKADEVDCGEFNSNKKEFLVKTTSKRGREYFHLKRQLPKERTLDIILSPSYLILEVTPLSEGKGFRIIEDRKTDKIIIYEKGFKRHDDNYLNSVLNRNGVSSQGEYEMDIKFIHEQIFNHLDYENNRPNTHKLTFGNSNLGKTTNPIPQYMGRASGSW